MDESNSRVSTSLQFGTHKYQIITIYFLLAQHIQKDLLTNWEEWEDEATNQHYDSLPWTKLFIRPKAHITIITM